MNLARLQAEFQATILGESDKDLESICESSRLSRADRIRIYTQAYRIRLAEFVANDFPALRGALVSAYIEARASRYKNARWYARELPEFMEACDPWRQRQAWIDLAFFERALADAFDAADVQPLAIDALAAIAVEDQPQLNFEFQPGLVLFTVTSGTVDLYEAAIEGRALPDPIDAAGEVALVWRDQSQNSVYRLLEDDEALALDAARTGGSFGEICGLLGLKDSSDAVAARAATFLARWFGDGLVTGLSHGRSR